MSKRDPLAKARAAKKRKAEARKRETEARRRRVVGEGGQIHRSPWDGMPNLDHVIIRVQGDDGPLPAICAWASMFHVQPHEDEDTHEDTTHLDQHDDYVRDTGGRA